jgi:putative membrane protein
MTSLDDVDKRTWSTSYLPRGHHEFDPEKVLPVVYSDHPLMPSRLPPGAGFFDYFPILRPIKRIPKLFKPKQVEHHELENTRFISSSPERGYVGRKRKDPIDSNVPLEIMMYLCSYNAYLLKNSLLPPPAGTALTNSISALQDAISGLDRIKGTPLPFAYQAHLRMTLW